MTFRLKKKPSKPKRQTRHASMDPCNNTLQQIVDWASSLNVNFGEVYFDASCHTGYGDSDHNLETRVYAQVDESDEEYNKRLTKYEQDLEKYTQWLESNRTEIEARAKLEEEKKKAIILQEADRLKSHIKKLEKRLERLI